MSMATRASSRNKLTFAGVVATPPKLDNTIRLQNEVERLRKENDELKQRIVAIELRLTTMEKDKKEEIEQMEAKLKKTKVDVETTLTKAVKNHVQEVISNKVESRVASTLRERQRQDDIALNVRIGGLPSCWKGEGDIEFGKALPLIQAALPMIQWDEEAITVVTHEYRTNHAILTLKTKSDRIRLLQQSRLLQDTKFWFAEDLTPAQHKQKKVELQKVREAGKWAVYRGGKAIIQEFRTPKPASLPLAPS
ncbi:hypothetical protein GOP47_0019267 [Adiantum capillus-veneris]|uniref:Uncharacterized protein n=1 Tax=Adiantum capillus-veneris TaxID=13818 RepID=A0A9D4UES3_ADICA|nr:hypothetical protein GOP47_0019267 [Adiantum capillus-veneris]